MPMRSAEDRQLVDERDVDRAEDVLQQLRELGDLGRRDRDDLVADVRVDGGGALGAARGEAADDLRRGAHRVVGAAGVDALGREREREVLAGAQAGLLQQRHEMLARGAGERGRLEHHDLVARDHVCERPRGGQQRAEIGLAVARQRGRDADEDRLGLVQVAVARAEAAALAHDCRRSSDTSSIGERPSVSAATRAWSTSMPTTSCPASANATASGTPTYPRPTIPMLTARAG